MVWKHKLSNIDQELMLADCMSCGTIPVIYRKDRSRYICKAAKYNWNITKDIQHTCEICNGTTRIAYDHSHTTGKHRGWLCMKCNTALGLVNDDTILLEKLITYLKKSV